MFKSNKKHIKDILKIHETPTVPCGYGAEIYWWICSSLIKITQSSSDILWQVQQNPFHN